MLFLPVLLFMLFLLAGVALAAVDVVLLIVVLAIRCWKGRAPCA